MDKGKKNHIFASRVMVWAGIGLGALYWVFEAVIDYAPPHVTSLAERLFNPSLSEIGGRLAVGGLFVAFGILAHLTIMKRRQAEKTLQESEEKYRNLVERANDGITIIQNGVVKFVNLRLAEMRGETIEQIIGTPFADYVHPDALSQTATYYERRMAGEQVPPVYETMLKRKDGSKVYAELNAGLVTYQGKPADLVIVRDISDRRQAEERALRQIALMDALNKVLRETLTCETAADVARVCLAVAEQLTGSRFGFIGELNQAGRFDTITLSDPGWDACRMPESDAIAVLKNMEVRGIWGKAVKDGQSVIVNDPANHPDRVGIPGGHPSLISFLGVPLKRGGKTVGSLGLANKEQGYNLDDQQAVEMLSVAFMEALNSKRAEITLMQRATQLTLINDVGSQIAAVMDLNSVLERAAHLVQKSFGYHHAALFTLDHEQGELVMRTRSGNFAHLFPLDHRLRLDQGMVGWVGSHGQKILANDVDAEPRYVNLYPGVVPTRSELSVPIRVGEGIVGVLDVQSDQPNAFDENDVMVIETLADQIAVAFENARLYEAVQASEESERRFREQLSVLHEVNNELSKAPTFDDLCRQAVELGLSRLGFDRLGIWFLDKDPWFMTGSFGTDENGQLRDERGSRWPVDPESLAAQVLTHKIPIVSEIDASLRNDKGEAIGRGWEAFAAMWDGDQAIGYISADNLLRKQPLFKYQLELLRLYGDALGHLCRRKRAEETLAQHVQALARSNADLEQFAYIASHDLQEPLRMVSSYLQLLERRYQDQLDTDAHEFIRYAVEGAIRMQALINALLSYSRIGTRGRPFEPTDCALVLDRVLANLKVTIEESNAIVTCDPLPTVTIDGVQLTQVFQNLIGNAIKFHGKRRPEVHVGAQHRDGEWLFSVRDNGIGIDPKHYERVFVIFQRLHTREEYPGTGIGLAICKKIVERHGGRIWIESQADAGSTFYFTLPDKR